MSDQHPSLLKRLLAILYDSLLLFGALFFAALIPLLIFGESVSGHPVFNIYLITVCFLFFGWFWTHGGQTLGMKTWKICVCMPDGSQISWGRALLRFFAACLSWLLLGGGFLWALFDPENQTLHDRLSGTRLVYTTSQAESG
ncbi:MAG: RDD family protein [Gammaproteobacteria bacterium]|nr:RDD family protein [Gammaproteobacteria bacterium]